MNHQRKNSGKMPAFQFYPADWRKDPAVQSLDYETRGVWFEILCLMHESDERGVLMLNGHPMPEDALARLLGLDNQNLTTHLTKLLAYGVAKRRESDGAIFNKRMVEDERLCEIRRNAGKRGGNPILLNQNPTTRVNQNPTPSSSSSSSINFFPPSLAQDGGEMFAEVEKTTKPKKQSKADPRHREFIQIFESHYLLTTGTKYSFQAKDGVQLNTLLKRQPDITAQDWKDCLAFLKRKAAEKYSPAWLKDCPGSLCLICTRWSQIVHTSITE